MGLLKGIFNKMGCAHIRMLTKDCVKLIINTLRTLKYQQGDDVYIDEALDILIKEGSYRVIQEKNIKDLKTKFTEFVRFYVYRNLGRDIDYLSDDMDVLNEEIENCWIKIKESKISVKQ